MNVKETNEWRMNVLNTGRLPVIKLYPRYSLLVKEGEFGQKEPLNVDFRIREDGAFQLDHLSVFQDREGVGSLFETSDQNYMEMTYPELIERIENAFASGKVVTAA